MTIEHAPLLGLIWLASPALPVGGYSYSEGLEAAIDHGMVHDEASCADWLVDQLWGVQARGDMAVVAQAIPAWRTLNQLRLQELSAWVWATRESAEMRLQTEQMGRSMLEWLRHVQGVDPSVLQLLADLPASYPMAQALALALTGAEVLQALQACAFGWSENMTQAALKAVPLGQNAGQRILARLMQDIPAVARQAQALGDDQRQAFSPMLSILSSRHETQYSRLFRS
jgi:urease accessory protein